MLPNFKMLSQDDVKFFTYQKEFLKGDFFQINF